MALDPPVKTLLVLGVSIWDNDTHTGLYRVAGVIVVKTYNGISLAGIAGVIMFAAAGNTQPNELRSPYYNSHVHTLPIPAIYSGVIDISAYEDGTTLQ